MEQLLTPIGLRVLCEAVCTRPLLGLDFDGTIAPIVAHPPDAAVPVEISDRLVLLSNHLKVAIVTGRDAGDASARIGFSPAAIIGNHGAEGWLDTETADDPLATVREQLYRGSSVLRECGVEIENKKLSVALHYRRAVDPKRAIGAIIQQLQNAPRLGVRMFPGKQVINVVPASAPDKADALKALMASFARPTAIYMGDDANDEPVFRARIPGVLTVRVGRSRTSAARFFLNDVGEVATMLSHMITMLGAAAHPSDPRGPLIRNIITKCPEQLEPRARKPR